MLKYATHNTRIYLGGQPTRPPKKTQQILLNCVFWNMWVFFWVVGVCWHWINGSGKCVWVLDVCESHVLSDCLGIPWSRCSGPVVPLSSWDVQGCKLVNIICCLLGCVPMLDWYVASYYYASAVAVGFLGAAPLSLLGGPVPIWSPLYAAYLSQSCSE